MDWLEFAKVWGPAVPVFLTFAYFLRELINVQIPAGFDRIVKAVRVNRRYLRLAERQQRKERRELIKLIEELLIELRSRGTVHERDPDHEGGP